MSSSPSSPSSLPHGYEYDYLVIGGGSGGVSSAKRAASLYQKKVCVVEGGAWGGTCVNVGCVPKKIMFQAATLYETLHHEAAHYEITTTANPTTNTTTTTSEVGGKPNLRATATAAAAANSPPLNNNHQGGVTFDWQALKVKRDAYILRLNGLYLHGLQSAGVTVLEGWGSFVDDHTVAVKLSRRSPDGGDEEERMITVTAAHIVVAVGGKPQVFPEETMRGMEHCITSDGFFALDAQPKSAVVVGAGYIAVELAGVLNALGTETHLLLRYHQALRSFDAEISHFLDQCMVRDGMHIHRNTGGVAAVELVGSDQNNNTKKKKVTTVSGEVIENIDCVLMAAGRVPNVDELGLDKAGVVVTDSHHYIVVDDYQTTSVPHIYAIGDVCGKVELTPMAIAAGRRLADRLFGTGNGGGSHNNKKKNNATTATLATSAPKASYENVPTVVFSHPTIGTIGLTEAQAVAKYGQANLQIYKSTFVNLYYSMFNMAPADKPKTFVKLICAGITEQVVGLHIIGLAADEMLQGFGVAMKMGATKADFDACVAIHPTAAEEVVTLGTWGTSPYHSGAKVSPLYGAPAPEPTLAHPVPTPTSGSKM